MQPSQGVAHSLLTALEVQELLNIDRSTVYRMAEDGRLPAIRVGRSWRFPADRIQALITAPEPAANAAVPGMPATAAIGSIAATAAPAAAPQTTTPTAPSTTTPTATSTTTSATPSPGPEAADDTARTLDVAAAQAAVQVASELLGVMMVVTDMHGRPVTDVANPSRWYSAHADQPEVLNRCVAEWRDLADHPDLTPRFQQGELGFQCARAFVRHGSTLVGMVLAGGVSPSVDPATDPDLYHLDDAARQRVLETLPRIAAAISPTVSRPAAPTKEN
jgi:excisionase family DNA binding protein